MSNPNTGNPAWKKARSSGRPTYPSPITPTTAEAFSILALRGVLEDRASLMASLGWLKANGKYSFIYRPGWHAISTDYLFRPTETADNIHDRLHVFSRDKPWRINANAASPRRRPPQGPRHRIHPTPRRGWTLPPFASSATQPPSAGPTPQFPRIIWTLAITATDPAANCSPPPF